MSIHVFLFVFLLVVCLLFILALLWRLGWFPLDPASSPGAAKRTMLHRLRHRRARQTIARPVVSAPLPRRVKGQRLLLCAAFAR
jgi:hypothetical protein